jgi:hypothetical protein
MGIKDSTAGRSLHDEGVSFRLDPGAAQGMTVLSKPDARAEQRTKELAGEREE